MMRSTRRSAFTLWEMIVVMGLIGVAGLLTSHLFVASMTSIRTAPQVQEQQISLDRMTDLLRRDVWGASRLDVTGKSVTIEANGQKIQWTFGDKTATRSMGDSATDAARWAVPFSLEPRKDGASLVLQTTQSGGESRRFISQVLAATEGK